MVQFFFFESFKSLLIAFSLIIFGFAKGSVSDNYLIIYDPINDCFPLIEKSDSMYYLELLSPCELFDIPLSLMAYELGLDSDLLLATRSAVLKWDLTRKVEYIISKPSKKLAQEIGREKIAHYLSLFDYGNQDMSGDTSDNEGLPSPWINSSLKTTMLDQLVFMRKFFLGELPVSAQSIQATKDLLFDHEFENGWKYYFKIGVGNETACIEKKFTWYVGWIERENEAYIIIGMVRDLDEMFRYCDWSDGVLTVLMDRGIVSINFYGFSN